jgi:glucan phosphoethanolaminetransferase (alkaline phosphatase superfamily)
MRQGAGQWGHASLTQVPASVVRWAAGALARIWNWAEKDLFGPTVFCPFSFSFFFSISIPFYFFEIFKVKFDSDLIFKIQSTIKKQHVMQYSFYFIYLFIILHK